jgi:putative peptidoglycan lipid II flippase
MTATPTDCRPEGRRRGRGNYHRQVLSAAAIVVALGLLSRALGMGKDLAIAWRFGTADNLEAFLVQLVVVVFFTSNITNAVASIGIPAFVRALSADGSRGAQRLLSSVIVLVIAMASGYTALLAIFSGPLLRLFAGGFAPEKWHLAHQLFLTFLPFLPITAVTATFAAVLNARERFAATAILPSLGYFAFLTVVLLVGARYGAVSLVGGQLLAACVELAIAAAAMISLGYSLKPRWGGLDRQTKASFAQAAPLMIGGAMNGANPIIDQAMASHLAPGSVACLNYGCKVGAAIMGIMSTVIVTSMLPYLSKLVVGRDWAGLGALVRRMSYIVTGLSIPLATGLIVFSDDIVRLIFQHGAFTSHDSATVAQVLVWQSVQIPFFGLRSLAMQILYAIDRSALIGIWGIVSCSLNAGLDWLFMRRWGVPGIAGSTSCVVVVDLIMYTIFIYYWHKRYRQSNRTSGLIT